VLVAIGLSMRSHIDESFLFNAAQKNRKIPRLPIGVVLQKWKAATAAGFFINLVHSSYAYLSTVFIIAYAAKNLGMQAKDADPFEITGTVCTSSERWRFRASGVGGSGNSAFQVSVSGSVKIGVLVNRWKAPRYRVVHRLGKFGRIA
jgi:hypothetical protein